MAAVWTHGTWTVKAGWEEDFVAAWRDMARKATAELNVKGSPTLLRDRDRPNVFISFGPWESIEDVNAFRTSAAFRQGRERTQGMLESFEPRTLDEMGLDG